MTAPIIQDDIVPAFALSAFNDGEGEVTLLVHVPEDPSIKRHASMGLLYGLAIMVLDKEGALGDTVELLLRDGPINEIDACNRITLLLGSDANDLPS